jgi:hypothetical protein
MSSFSGVQVCDRKFRAHLWLKIPMNIPKLVQFADGREHFADIKSGVFLFEYAGIVQQCPKVASRHIFHREVDVLYILKSI